MLRRLTVVMTEQERQALQVLADRNLRPAREQLRFLVREEAQRMGVPVGEAADAHSIEDLRHASPAR